MSHVENLMIKRTYNGWAAEVRQVRGQAFYALVRKQIIPKPEVCELCGSTNGMTYHAEEYGSTWGDYLKSTHPLCCYCHAIIHVRWRFPNRWGRFVQRALVKEIPAFPYRSMHEVYGAFKQVEDLPEHQPIPESDHWLSRLPVVGYHGPPKVALMELDGVLVPDNKVYGHHLKELEGIRHDATTYEFIPYKWSASETTPG